MKNIPLFAVRQINDLKDMLNSSVELFGGRTAFLSKKKGEDTYSPITYTSFKNDVDFLGTALLKLGLYGKRVALISENRYEWCVSYLSVLNGVGIIVPLDKELPANEIESLLTRSKVNAVIFSSVHRENILSISQKLKNIDFLIDIDNDADFDNYVDSDSNSVNAIDSENNLTNKHSSSLSMKQLISIGKKAVIDGDRSYLDASIDNETMSIILFTSATTDKSKAVMLSHKNISANLMAMCSMLYIDEKDTFLSVLPLHHTYECTCGFLCQMYRGSTVAFCDGLRHIIKNFAEAKVTMMNGVPLIFEAMYKRLWDQAKKSGKDKKLKTAIKLSNFLKSFGIDITKKIFKTVHDTFGGHVRLFISGAAGIDPLVSKGFRDLGILFVQGYGLTECAPIVALNRNVDFKDDAAGLPLPGLEVKIDKPSSDGIGEIIVKGPSVMMGYYENEEATNTVFIDGWFHTGDLGFIDNDGFIHITGRKKNVIVTKNGKNIFPEEIETLLNRSEYIKESLVFGKDDDVYGDVVVSAIIVPDMEKILSEFGESSIDSEKIYELVHKEVKTVNKVLVTYKYIKDFKLRDEEFAKTTTKKIKRYLAKV